LKEGKKEQEENVGKKKKNPTKIVLIDKLNKQT